jgi:hypothetical protein
MKKKMLSLGCGIAVLAVLFGLYTYKVSSRSGSTSESATEETTDTTDTGIILNTGQYALCDKSAETLRDITVTNGEAVLKLKYTDSGYVAEGYEKAQLDMSNVASVASNFIGLYSDNKIDDTDLTRYGLDNPTATGVATYEDGSSVTITLGNLTADGKYYYMQSSDLDGIYLVDELMGNRLLYTVNDLTDKTLTAIKPDYVDYVGVKAKNGDELLMYYDSEKSNASSLAAQGLATLTMEKPIEGAIVYPYNLEGSVLSTCKQLTLASVVEVQPDDYSVYGLDDPEYIIRLRDSDAALELKVGGTDAAGNSYVMVDDRVSVFLMDSTLLQPLENYTVTDFVEKFVSLHNRTDVSSVVMQGEYGDFTLDFKTEGDNKIVTDEKGTSKDNRLVLINDKEVQSDSFKDFYELLVGLGFDQIEEHTQKSGEPNAVLTYYLTDGSEQSVEFYQYSDNFYSVGKDGKYDMLVSRQSVKQIVDKALALIN